VIDWGAETHWTKVSVPPFLRRAWIRGPRSRPGSGAKSSTAMVGTVTRESRGQNEDAVALAAKIEADQTSEIATMRGLLTP